MSNCLVLGGNGFIGSHIVDYLIKNNHNVKILSKLNIHQNNVECIKGDFLNDEDRKEAIKDIDFIYHFISTTNPQNSILDPVYDTKSNVIGTIKLLQDITNSNVKKIIFSSSGGSIYGESSNITIKEDQVANPITPYGISKLMIEKYLHYFKNIYGLDYTIFRYSNVYGEGQYPSKGFGVIPTILANLKNNINPILYGNTIRDYIYINDILSLNLEAMFNKSKYNIFNVGSGFGTSLNRLIDTIQNITNIKITPIHMNKRKGDISKIVLDISRIQEEYKWTPKTSLNEGIKNTWNWINK